MNGDFGSGILPPLPPFDPGAARRPICIAHRAGNTRRALRAALAAAVDWFEVDVWWHYGRVVARHDPALWRLPLTYGRWHVAPGTLRPITLDELIDAVAGTPVRLLLDLKGEDPRLPGALVDTLRRRGVVAGAALCGQEWGPLDAARALEPRMQVFFSLGREDHLSAYLRRLEDGSAPPLVSIRHTMLSPERVADLHRRGVTAVSWTVNDPDRARELVAWGVDGVISDSLPLLAGLRDAGGP